MFKTFAIVATLALASTAAQAQDLNVGGVAGVTVAQSSASLSSSVNGNYGTQGNVQYQIGNQSGTLLKNNADYGHSRVATETYSVSFEGVTVKGAISLPTARGYSQGSAAALSGGFALNADW